MCCGLILGGLLIGSIGAAMASDGDRAASPCSSCHNEYSDPALLDITQTKHGVVGDRRTPFANNSCVSCHGASVKHMRRPSAGELRVMPDLVFGGQERSSPSAEQDSACIDCHANGSRLHWRGSEHESNGVTCVACHSLHSSSDPVLEKISEAEVCFTCHQQQRAELRRPSTHPLLDGQMSCSDCHNTHGSSADSLLIGFTLNETCYSCHAEKRGPFLWEHAPAREDCGLCHRPHGSIQQSMLTARTPWLCQQCHLAQRHPSSSYSGTGLPGASTPSGAQSLLGKNCMNCHPQVHGSNHPSGARITR